MDTLGGSAEREGDVAPGVGLTNLTGKQIGRYLIGQQLGSGGVATVYRAYDQVQGQTVALKLLLPGADDKAYTRFRNEAMTAGSLRHPHIVRILQIGTAPHGEVAYIAMELVEGESLADLLRQRGRLRPEESANLLEPIARALAVAHRHNVVHRDVKPGNILLRPVSPGAPNSVQLEALEHPVVPLLTDFGIARALDAPELTNMGRTVGTPAYMAPEQCAGSREIDGRADIYALGAVLYRCVAGRLPFTGTTTQILHAHVYEPLTIDENTYRQLSPLMVEVFQRSLAKRPEDRYATADELADALALAAGRTPRRSDESVRETTATLTMMALPVANTSAETSSTTVLVPAPGTAGRGVNPLLRSAASSSTSATQTAMPLLAESQVVAPSTAAKLAPPGRTNGRPTWRSVLLTIVGGAAIMGIGIVLGMQTPRLLRTAPLLPPVVDTATFDTATVAAVTADAATVNTATVNTATVDPSTTTTTPPDEEEAAPLSDGAGVVALATHTTNLVTPGATPTPAETAPNAPPTAIAAPSDTPTPPPTETPTGAPTATPDIEATLVACTPLIDETLQRYVENLTSDQRATIGCPVGEALIGPAQMTPFERGYMVGFNDVPELYIVYLAAGVWERQPLLPEGDLPEDLPQPPEGRYLPVERFAPLWAAEQRWERIGFAVDPMPVDFTAVIQEFEGAVLIGNRDATEVAVLPVNRE
ncbi:MAG: serine/threonine-protein kinase [Caldilinea sp.]